MIRLIAIKNDLLERQYSIKNVLKTSSKEPYLNGNLRITNDHDAFKY